jgi:hypothetical protein
MKSVTVKNKFNSVPKKQIAAEAINYDVGNKSKGWMNTLKDF